MAERTRLPVIARRSGLPRAPLASPSRERALNRGSVRGSGSKPHLWLGCAYLPLLEALIRSFLYIALALPLLSGCTSVEDFGPDGGGWADVVTAQPGPCSPDPCAPGNRECVDGDCGACLTGFEESEGVCVPIELDPCNPDPCAVEHKTCFGGFCGECLEGYITTDSGSCLEPNACYPNPCSQELKTVCLVAIDGSPTCVCDPSTHDDGFGGCTFEPCVPDPCSEEDLFTHCQWAPQTGPIGVCTCPPGQLEGVDAEGSPTCLDDPCEPNPCQEFARTVCSVGSDESGPIVECSCEPGFALEGASCMEQPFENLLIQPAAEDDVVIDDGLQLFMDDYLVQLNNGLSRRLHTATLESVAWEVAPEPDAQIGRARANGSLVQPSSEFRSSLPEEHPLRESPYWLYYMGYRQLFTLDSEPSWLCIATADSPAGPWQRPVLVTELQEDGVTEVVNPGSNCILRIDGMEVAEIGFHEVLNPPEDPEGYFLLSLTRSGLGNVEEPGLFMEMSTDGLNFDQWGTIDTARVLLSDDIFPPSIYTRIERKSRAILVPDEDRYLVLSAIGSDSHGDARAILSAGPMEAVTLPKQPNALEARAILGPSAADLSDGFVYGDMTAFRVSGLWIGLVQKSQSLACPRASYVSVATSRDGHTWVPIRDQVSGSDTFIANNPITGTIDASLETLTGGEPATAGGLWHFYSGGVRDGDCAVDPQEGGLIRHTIPVGAISGLGTDSAGTAVIITKPMRMPTGQTGSQLFIHGNVASQLRVQVESLSAIDTVLEVAEGIVPAGEHQGTQVAIAPLNALTSDRFRLRFSLIGAGEIFGFRMDDPLCDPNPCDAPGKNTCDSSSGVVQCVCDPPKHDDGLGGCTLDPCLPDPCTGPHEEGCTAVGSEESGWVTQCGCEDGWIKSAGACVKDPCEPSDGLVVCAPPGPDRCQVVDGQAECYCPEGSEAGNLGCYETDGRAFVSSQTITIGNVIGVDAADDACNSLAAAHDIPGEYVAWLSQPGDGAVARLSQGFDGPWRTWDPEVEMWTALVAENIADLTDGSLSAALGYTETTQPVPETCLTWTGTMASGGIAKTDNGAAAEHCSSWSTNQPGQLGLAGRCNAQDSQWTQWGPVPCSQALRLYCFQLVPEPADPIPGPPEGCGDGQCADEEICDADCDPAASCKEKCGQFEDGSWPCSCLAECEAAGNCCADLTWWCAPTVP